MDAITDPANDTITVMSSSQVGKTEIINNTFGRFIELDPGPMMLVQPTEKMAEAWSKDRFAPMIRDCPSLHGKVKDPRSRDSGNTLLHKTFPGGHITMAGANSPASLASRPIRIVCCDEIDRFPESAGTEGDPVDLAEKRTSTFSNKKKLRFSTPTVKGRSRIERSYNASDRQRCYVPCPQCGAKQILRWSQVKWNRDKEGAHDPSTAHYICEPNGCIIEEKDKPGMLANYEWIAERPNKGHAGFHINELYSPWISWAEVVSNFLVAYKSPQSLKVWTNTALGEPFEEREKPFEANELLARREDYGDVAPEEVLLVTAGVDVQHDRLELELLGWGLNEENWSLAYHVLRGDPSDKKVWQELDKVLLDGYPSQWGMKLEVHVTCIDTGGHHADQVYEFCRTRLARRVYPIKGSSQAAKPIVSKPSRNNRLKLPLFLIGTNAAKELLFSRLQQLEVGQGYSHFPRRYDKEYFDGLTAEQQVTKLHHGFASTYWDKIRARNEPLDCRVYNIAAFKIANINMETLAAHIRDIATKPAKKNETQHGSQPEGWLPDNDGDWLS